MEFTCAVWFEEALAHYHVSKNGDGRFVARLLHCITQPKHQSPPHKVTLVKEGAYWWADNNNQELVQDLSNSIEDNTELANLKFFV